MEAVNMDAVGPFGGAQGRHGGLQPERPPVDPSSHGSYAGARPSSHGSYDVVRQRPPVDRAGVTHKVTLYEPDGAKVNFYITLNCYPDGRPCEVFTKATGCYQGWADVVCRLASLLLQQGVPLETVCRQLERAHFAPFGMVPAFGFARSFPDYLARWIQKQISRRDAEGAEVRGQRAEDGTPSSATRNDGAAISLRGPPTPGYGAAISLREIGGKAHDAG